MFKRASAEHEIAQSMNKVLDKLAEETMFHRDELSKAIDYLDAAAGIFEQAGLEQFSEQLINILTEVAGQVIVDKDTLNAKDK